MMSDIEIVQINLFFIDFDLYDTQGVLWLFGVGEMEFMFCAL